MRIRIPGVLALVMSTAVATASCAHSQAEHDQMVQTIESLKQANKELEERGEEQIAELAAQLEDLNDELDMYKSLAQKRAQVMEQLMDDLQELIDAGKLEVKMVDGRMLLELPGDVLFPSNSTSLGSEGSEVLSDVADALAKLEDIELQVEGHTDADPIVSGPFEDNWELSCERSLVVVRYLEELGISPVRLSAAGYSKYQPVASNDTEEGEAENRRIEITVVPDLSALPDPEQIEESL